MRWVKRNALIACAMCGLASPMFARPRIHYCAEVPVTTETVFGWLVLDADLRYIPMAAVSGEVQGPGTGSLKTLVQVFPRKQSDPPWWPLGARDRGSLLVACVTGGDGRFGFSLPQGEYELLFSQGLGIDVTSVAVRIRRGFHRRRKFLVEMQPGS